MTGAANANVQNQINVSLIFNFLRHHGETYRAEISRKVGLSPPAVSRAIESLLEQGYLSESGNLVTRNGKKVARLIVNPDKGCVIAIDFLKGRSRFGCFDFTGDLIYQTVGDYFSENGDVLKALVEKIKQFIGEASLIDKSRPLPEIKAICLGVPCAVDTKSGKTTGAWLYDFLVDLNFKTELESVFDIPVFIENDIKLAAFAENRLGKGMQHHNLVYIDINKYGIGSGIILDGHIVRGALGLAGEIGYSIIPGVKTDKKYHPMGYLESQASLKSIVGKVLECLEAGEIFSLAGSPGDDPGTDTSLTARKVFQAAVDGDSLCRRVINQAVELLISITTNLILAVNPEIVIIGGDIYDMPGAEELFLVPLKQKMGKILPFEAPIVEFSILGSDACMRGASLFGVESILSGLYPFTVDSLSSSDSLDKASSKINNQENIYAS